MTSRGINFQWRSDSTQLKADFQTITANVKRVQRALLQLGKTGDASKLADFFAGTKEEVDKAQDRVEKLKQAITDLQTRQAQATGGVALTKNLRELAKIPGTGFASISEVRQGVSNLKQEISSVEQGISRWQDDLQLFNQKLAESNRLAEQNKLATTLTQVGSGAFQRRVQQAGAPASLDTAVQERLLQLEQARIALIERRAALEQRVFEQIDPAGRANAQKQLLDLRRQEEQSLNNIQRLQAQRAAVENRLNALGSQRLANVVAQLRAGRRLSQVQQPALTATARADLERFVQLTERLLRAQSELATTQQRAARGKSGFAFTAGRIGVADEFERVSTQISSLDKQIAGLAGPGRLDEIAQIAPKLFQQIQALGTVTKRYDAIQKEMNTSTTISAERFERLSRAANNYARLQQNLTIAVERGTRALREQGILKPLSFEDIEAQLSGLERTLVGAFRGFGRRFQATLQFALSAGLIFGVQRFLREFVDTAIEVERAFEDIATALEFDIEAPRGTLEFRRELEGVRRQVIDIANEFNVLPTVANEVAFKMVARFQDMGNAMEATRAQLLALKISTIETDEVLRALTATAEIAANEVLTDMNKALTLQERLLQRETAAAESYANIIDVATVIQQKWGVEFEDTVEGVARALPTFQNLGFTVQETAAIVASATRVLPGTGVQIAEKLTRAFGPFTQPETRDKLLELAAASDNLRLSLADFDRGGKFVLQQIQKQIDDLDPKELVQLQQIIGQRREIEVVAAVLGTADLQADINSITNAAGAAEDRFSFLEDTTRELINSISTQFQELAQNLERIGVLTPFKLILRAGNQLLTLLNNMLKGVIDIIDALNSVPILKNIGLGDVLSTTLALGLALRSVLRTLEAIGAAQGALGAATGLTALTTGGGGLIDPRTGEAFKGAQAGAKLTALTVASNFAAKGLSLAGQAAEKLVKGVSTAARSLTRMATLILTGNIPAIKAAILATYDNIRAKIAEARTSGGRAFTGVLTAGQGRALGIVAAIGAITTIFSAFRSAIQASQASIEAHEDAVEKSREAILAEAEARNAPEEETRLELAQAEFDIARERQDSGGFFSNQLLSSVSALIPDLNKTLNDSAFVRALLEFNDISTKGLSDAEVLRKGRQVVGVPSFNRKQVIPGSAEFNEIAEAVAFIELLRASIAEFQSKAASIEGREADVRQLSNTGARLLAELDRASSPEEVLALIPGLESWAAAWASLANEEGVSLEGVEGSIKTAKDKIEEFVDKADLGRLSFDQAIVGVETQIDALKEQLDLTSDPQLQDEIESAIREAQQTVAKLIQQKFDDQRAINDATLSEEASLRANIESLKRESDALKAAGQVRLAQQVQIELINAQKALNDFLIARIRTQASIARQFAQTPEETLEILQREMRALVNAALLSFNPEIIEAVAQIVVEMQAQINEIKRDIESRRAVATARGTGPILSTLNRLKADLVGLQIDLARVDSASVVALELRNQIAENLAQQAQELFRRAAAATLLQAGVNDSIRKLKAQITINSKELELTGNLFGEQSAAFLELKLKQQELQRSLAEALLELRDLNRRLGSDITNSLEQAQLDLLAIMEKLQAPDLGPLEKARLELEKKNAEAAAQRAFFDDRLFQLRFAFETGDIGVGAYIASLEKLLDQVDTSTQQGKEIFLQIQSIIDGLSDDVNDLAFNVPTNIRLPTIFEIRRSLAADQMGVNYVDNRQQNINLEISDQLTLEQVLEAIDKSVLAGSSRVPAGAAGITIGAF